ncbi:C39 family peptidase [Merdimonas faecis]
MTLTGQKNPSKRKQQVRRYWAMIGLALVLCIGILGYHFLGGNQEKEAVAITQTKQQKELWEQAKQEAGLSLETPEEHLEQVRIQATVQGYPKDVKALQDKKPSTVDYVEAYGEKQGQIYAEDIGDDYVEGQIPLLIQWDERWGYAPYGTSVVAVSGCGPTCMAMVAAGLNHDPTITPAKVAAYGTENSYVDEENNTYWAFMQEAGADFGLSCYSGFLTEQQLAAELSAGHPVICSMGPGYFTQNGHFIVMTGYENGQIRINDPFSEENSARTWSYAEIQGQIKAMWVYSLAGQ